MTQPIPIQWLPHWRPADRLVRESRYAYACSGCSRCCRDKVITVNPYEVARLARSQAMSTTQFLAEHTSDVALNRRADATCVFLGEKGCTVHPDRPLVCRLYPLGRHLNAEGQETFAHLAPHPETAGHYSEDGTVQQWLDAQGAGAFIAATDAYLGVFHRLFTKMAEHEGGEGVGDWPDDPRASPVDWLDIDLAIGEPKDGETVEQRMAAHIRWLDEREI
jgi:Fe-S-cluster containining protein